MMLWLYLILLPLWSYFQCKSQYWFFICRMVYACLRTFTKGTCWWNNTLPLRSTIEQYSSISLPLRSTILFMLGFDNLVLLTNFLILFGNCSCSSVVVFIAMIAFLISFQKECINFNIEKWCSYNLHSFFLSAFLFFFPAFLSFCFIVFFG